MAASTPKGLITVVAGLMFIGVFSLCYIYYPEGGLFPRKPAPPATPEEQMLYSAISEGHEAEALKLLDKHPEMIRANFGGEGTVLHVAARYNQIGLIPVLLKRGASLQSRGQWRCTPLHWACWWGSKQAVDELLKLGTPVDVRGDSFGSTPLLWAAHGSANVRNPNGDYPGTIDLLLHAGARADTENASGVPAVTMANPEIQDLLKAHGAHLPDPTTRPRPNMAPPSPSRPRQVL